MTTDCTLAAAGATDWSSFPLSSLPSVNRVDARLAGRLVHEAESLLQVLGSVASTSPWRTRVMPRASRSRMGISQEATGRLGYWALLGHGGTAMCGLYLHPSACVALLSNVLTLEDGQRIPELGIALLDALVLRTLEEDTPLSQRILLRSGVDAELFVAFDPERLASVDLDVGVGAPGAMATGLVSLTVPRSELSDWCRSFEPGSKQLWRVAPLVQWAVCFGFGRIATNDLATLTTGSVLFPAWPIHRARGSVTPCSLQAVGQEREGIFVPISLLEGHEGWQLQLSGQQMNDKNKSAQDVTLEEALATAPIELRFELGRKVLTAAEVASLRAGEAIDLGVELGSPIAIVAAEGAIGEGELVEMGGRVGVRILSLHLHEQG